MLFGISHHKLNQKARKIYRKGNSHGFHFILYLFLRIIASVKNFSDNSVSCPLILLIHSGLQILHMLQDPAEILPYVGGLFLICYFFRIFFSELNIPLYHRPAAVPIPEAYGDPNQNRQDAKQ